MPRKPALGKGLNALIPQQERIESGLPLRKDPMSPTVDQPGTWVREIEISRIVPNPRQPRRVFNEIELEELASSIKIHGILQPILVRSVNRGYELVSGERRLRAADLAGIKTVPAIVISPDDSLGSLIIALVENVQRTDLNAVELARAYQQLQAESGRTQEEIAGTVGKSRSYVANTLRLLELSDSILEALHLGKITAGHARALLMAPQENRTGLFRKILLDGLSVRQAERCSKEAVNISDAGVTRTSTAKTQLDNETERMLNEMVKALESALGRKCRIELRKGGRGRLVLEFNDNRDLENLVQRLR